MLTEASEAEVPKWISAYKHLQNEDGHRQVAGNGRLPHRKITTGVGQVEIEPPGDRGHRRARALDAGGRNCS